jgi:hypothetical protein
MPAGSAQAVADLRVWLLPVWVGRAVLAGRTARCCSQLQLTSGSFAERVLLSSPGGGDAEPERFRGAGGSPFGGVRRRLHLCASPFAS